MIGALLLGALLAQAPQGKGEAKPPPQQPDARGPISPKGFTAEQQISIKADRLEIKGRGNQAVWLGHVRAKRGDTNLSCDRLVASYTTDQQISKIECLGSVEILDGDRWAKGERAEFDNLKGILTLTGNPEARQGPNHMRGSRVTFYMERDVIEVQGAEAVIIPRSVQEPRKP